MIRTIRVRGVYACIVCMVWYDSGIVKSNDNGNSNGSGRGCASGSGDSNGYVHSNRNVYGNSRGIVWYCVVCICVKVWTSYQATKLRTYPLLTAKPGHA